MSNKDKKLFKKERRKINSLNTSEVLDNLRYKVSILENKLEKINNIIYNKEIELTQFQDSVKDMTITVLNELHKKHVRVKNNESLVKNIDQLNKNTFLNINNKPFKN